MKILIIEDNEDIRLLLRKHFERSGVQADIEEAGSVKSGLKRLASCHYDWLILDQNLPGGTGLSILESLSFPSTKVIMYSSSGDDHHLQVQALCLGADAVFAKSRPVGELVEYIVINHCQ